MKNVRIQVFGMVQGVWFRSRTQEQAQRLDLTGWVKNNDDGSVEIAAQGDPESVQRLVDWCRLGPLNAKVERVEVIDESNQPHFTSFDVV